MTRSVIVIGAGIGGLSTAAILAKAGFDVTVLEAHIYPGGCAGTFYHQGYRFDAGATLAGGFYPGGPMDLLSKAAGIPSWPANPADPAMVVHLPSGRLVTRYADERRQAEYQEAFGPQAGSFWDWQERTADAMWALALRSPAWPPQSPAQVFSLIKDSAQWLGEDMKFRLHPGFLADAFRPVAAHLKQAPPDLRLFVDAQLLIAAQTTSAHANAFYGASALDLPRRGVAQVEAGMGAIAETLVQALRNHGGSVLYRQEVTHIQMQVGRVVAVETKRGGSFSADIVVVNLPPWNIARLLGTQASVHIPHARLHRLSSMPDKGWGAFMAYIGVDGKIIPPDFVLHHQVLVSEPLGEGNSIFLSISPAEDLQRAPTGQRAITISTHTALAPWWHLHETDRPAYEARKHSYLQRILDAAERVIPGLQQASSLILPGTPLSFERFTRRAWGWVGGFPQVNLFQTWAPRLADNLWMVGDSVFPGQSAAAVALGGMRVAGDIAGKFVIYPA